MFIYKYDSPIFYLQTNNQELAESFFNEYYLEEYH